MSEPHREWPPPADEPDVEAHRAPGSSLLGRLAAAGWLAALGTAGMLAVLGDSVEAGVIAIVATTIFLVVAVIAGGKPS